MRSVSRFIGALFLTAVATSVAAGQDAPTAPTTCHASPCLLEFDWGNGQSAAGIPADRRYGAPTEFEATLRSRLAERDFHLTSDAASGYGLRITLRMSMTSALCDFLPGTSSARNCQTIRDVGVSFTTADSSIKRPGAQRIVNRCGDPKQMMTMTQMGKYVADVLAYTIEGEATKESKPSAKC